jgi:alkylation response protein AidB-like acyl-CoA dehydrogenase
MSDKSLWWTGNACATARAAAFSERLGQLDLRDSRLGPAGTREGVIREVFRDLWDLAPFREYVPEEFGGRGGEAAGVLAVVDAVASEHPALALSLALTGALFALPVAAHGRRETQSEVFARLLGDEVCLGGMMMTEPGCGTDVLRAETQITPTAGGFRVQGMKHWSGHTGHADYWLVFGSRPGGSRAQSRGYVVAEARAGGGPSVQGAGDPFRVEEYYSAWGLQPIPYGRTRVDARVPEAAWLGEEKTYTEVLGGVLTGSRLTFAGPCHGAIRGILRRAREHVEHRHVGGHPLRFRDQVQARVTAIRMAELYTRALCLRVADLDRVRSIRGPRTWEATLVKAWATDLMSDAAEHFAILRGASGYDIGGPGLGAVVTSHPWRIFEGPNDVLFEQLARGRAKALGARALGPLLDDAWHDAPPDLRGLDEELSLQRQWVTAGRILAAACSYSWARSHETAFEPQELAELRQASVQYLRRMLPLITDPVGVGCG